MKKVILLGFIVMMNIVFGQEVTSSIVSSWETGYSGELKIRPTKEISNWEVTVQYRGVLNSLWNGIYTDTETNVEGVRQLVITPESYNKTIEADGIISIGFGVTKLANQTAEIMNVTYDFTLVTEGNSVPVNGVKNVLVWQRSQEDTTHVVLSPTFSKVGIGTNNLSTTHTLFVAGGIMTDKVKVAVENSADWPDYVFEKDYVLMPLSEVEAFLKDNKHLPNIPSATTVMKEGQDLAEMNKLLLQKVEELTLHVINLDKKIKALEAQK